MIRQFFPVSDASVYEEFPVRNTGTDEILEVGKNETGAYAIRSIIGFDMDALAAAAPSASSLILHLKTAIAKRLPDRQELQFALYSGSWTEGTGYFYQDVYQIQDGIGWTTISGSFAPTASVTGSNPWRDLSVDVTSLLSGTSGIQSLVVQFPSASEADTRNRGVVRFFGRNTHTIYQPVIEARWSDQVYVTGSLSSSFAHDYLAIPHSLKAVYTQGETARVDVTVREKYPLKTFANAFTQYTTTLHLPATSYFSIVDETTGFSVVPFSDATRIHQTATGAYFTFVVENMWARRFYRVLIKVVDVNGAETVFDNRHIFKVAD